jgi:hypothetical protein
VSAQIVEFIAEIGQRRKLRRDRPDLRFEERALLGGGSGELPLQGGGVTAKPVEQEGERSPRHADGGVHENGVDRRVIDLHAELFHADLNDLVDQIAFSAPPQLPQVSPQRVQTLSWCRPEAR